MISYRQKCHRGCAARLKARLSASEDRMCNAASSEQTVTSATAIQCRFASLNIDRSCRNTIEFESFDRLAIPLAFPPTIVAAGRTWSSADERW